MSRNEAQVNDPPGPDLTNDASRAIGFYSDGALSGAVELPPEGESFLKIFRLRDRAWGTASLVSAIQTATRSFRAEFPYGERVQIGDIANRRGGMISSVHVSHQNGLDADIAYLRMNHVERDPDTTGPNGFGESFVKNGKVTENFDAKRNWFLLKNVVATGVVTRIFVDPAIKKLFCNRATELDPGISGTTLTETLRRLRPYSNHDDHFHVRIACPETSPKCVPQSEPPSGTSCSDVSSASAEEHGPADGDGF